MRHTLTLGAFSLAAALAAAPVMAQTGNATHSTAAAPATGTPATTTAATPANSPSGTTAQGEHNPVLTQSGEARASKVIGSSVYNDHDEKVGSVDDLVIGKDGRLHAVLSVGGFLGMGTKYVEVPYGNLLFGNTRRDNDNRVVLKGATKESLKTQAGYNYYKS